MSVFAKSPKSFFKQLWLSSLFVLSSVLAIHSIPNADACSEHLRQYVMWGGPGRSVKTLSQAEWGSHLLRSNELIPLEKSPDTFTARVRDDKDLQRLEALQALGQVSGIEPIKGEYYKVTTPAQNLDTALEAFRKQGGVAHHVYSPQETEGTHYFLTDRISVRFDTSVSEAEANRIVTDVGGKILRTLPGLRNTYLIEVTSQAGKNPIKLSNELNARTQGVMWAEPDLIHRFYKPPEEIFRNSNQRLFQRPGSPGRHEGEGGNVHGPTGPATQRFTQNLTAPDSFVPDPLEPLQWHLHNAGDEAELVKGADIGAREAWTHARGKGVVVALIDDGVDITHPDFEEQVVHPANYADGSATDPLPGAEDYHGTPCAGVIAAARNGQGVVGVAPECKLMPVRISLALSDSELADIFSTVAQRADVISCSWGTPPIYAPLSRLLDELFTEITKTGGPLGKGVNIVFASGNWNAPLNDPDNERFEWFSGNKVVVTKGPIRSRYASHSDVVSVSAITSEDRKAGYSNWGDEITVAGYSNNFHPLEPWKKLPGLGIVTTDNEPYGQGFTPKNRFTDSFGGTSSAAPLVAGVLALIRSQNPSMTAHQARQLLIDSAKKVEDLNEDPILGTRYGTYDAKGHSRWFGYGAAHAGNALRKSAAVTQLTNAIVARALQDELGLKSKDLESVYGPEFMTRVQRVFVPIFGSRNPSHHQIAGAVRAGQIYEDIFTTVQAAVQTGQVGKEFKTDAVIASTRQQIAQWMQQQQQQ